MMKLPITYVYGSGATRSKRPSAYPAGVWGRAVRQVGATLILDDGRSLLDWVGSLGAMPLGADPRIASAVMAQYVNGSLFSLPSVLEEEVAERLAAVIPAAEQVIYTKTGSEATQAAVRLARAATGRRDVIRLEGHYHGWHAWYAQTTDEHPGVYDDYSVLVAEDLEAVADDLEDETIAAVILEPATRHWVPTATDLQALSDVCHARGTLLIFDEMIMGGRLALGGGSEYFGVTPDLATYGKAFGAGMPLAFVAGPEDIMRHGAYISGTYSGETLSLAACRAMLDIYQAEPVVERLHRYGRQVRLALHAVGCQTRGVGPFFSLDLPEADRWGLCAHAASRGILINPTFLAPSAAMSPEDVTETCDVLVAGIEKRPWSAAVNATSV